VIELGVTEFARHASEARDLAAAACAAAARPFAGVRPYARGAAFLHKVVHV
jgi:hypothetical protein